MIVNKMIIILILIVILIFIFGLALFKIDKAADDIEDEYANYKNDINNIFENIKKEKKNGH